MATVPFSRSRTPKLDPLLAKKLPCNLDAERSILGAILQNPKDSLKQLCGATDPASFAESFFLDQHKRAYLGMLRIFEQDAAVDLVMLTEHLETKGELEAAGGAPYLASLADGVPKVNNIGHYVHIVQEKKRLRDVIHIAHAMQERAIEGADTPELLFQNYTDQLTAIQKPRSTDNPLVTVSYKELLTLDLPKADPLIDPLVTFAGSFMLFSWSGWGKSWIATELAFRVAKGVPTIFNGHSGAGGHWPIFGPARTLYLYGEMHGERIRQRLQMIAKAHDTSADFEDFVVASKDYQRIARAPRAAHTWRPSLATPADRKHVEERIFGEGIRFLVLDNISTLWSAAQEDQSNQVAILKDWFIDLNAKGITVCFLQHAGKGGDFLGDSAQVHILDSYVQLEHAPDYRPRDGLRVNLHIKKLREFGDPSWSVPFEAQLVTVDGSAQWLTRPALAAQKKAAYELYCNGAPATEALKEFAGSVKRATLYRWYKEFKENRSGNATAEDEE